VDAPDACSTHASGLTRTLLGRGDVSVVGREAVVHDAHNDSDAPIKLVGVYGVEKGKPLASPAP
jgi:hypothetical protein